MKKRIRFMQGAGFALTALAISFAFGSCSKNDSVPAPVVVKHISFSELKALTTVPANTKISGIVLSDATHGNIESNTLVLQETSGGTGLVVALSSAAPTSLNPGDSVQINVSGKTLASVNGETVLQNIVPDSLKLISHVALVPSKSNIADITKNANAYDGTLVTIPATSLTGTGTTWNGTLTVKDSTGTASSVVQSGATFAGKQLPASVSSLTGIVRVNGSTVNLNLRDTTDLAKGAISQIIVENFDNPVFNPVGAPNAWTRQIFTQYGRWSLNAYAPNAAYGLIRVYKDVAENASFLMAGKFYPYVRDYDATDQKGSTFAFLPIDASGNTTTTFPAGMPKTVTISFAASAAPTLNLNGTTMGPIAVDVAFDQIQVSLGFLLSNGGKFSSQQSYFDGIFYFDPTNTAHTDPFVLLSPSYTTAGKLYTATFKIPSKADLIAKGATQAEADALYANPMLSFSILAKSHPLGLGFVVIKEVDWGF